MRAFIPRGVASSLSPDPASGEAAPGQLTKVKNTTLNFDLRRRRKAASAQIEIQLACGIADRLAGQALLPPTRGRGRAKPSGKMQAPRVTSRGKNAIVASSSWRAGDGSRSNEPCPPSSFCPLPAARCPLLLFVALLALCATTNAADPPKAEPRQPFRENASLPLDNNLLKHFRVVKDLLADERWDDAINKIQEISQTESKSLVLVQPGTSGGVATYVNVVTRCNLLLSRISPDGRAAFRRKTDPQAKRWFENWLKTRDESELLRIVRHSFLSSYADDAIWALGEAAWDRGDFSAAALWWGQLIPLPDDADPDEYPTVLRYPDTDLSRAEILARIVLCSIMEGAHERAAQELKTFSEQYPLAEGWLSGKKGRLVDQLQSALDQSLKWKRITPAAEVATFALSPQRFLPVPQSIDIGAVRWSHPLPLHLLPRQAERLPYLNEPLCYHPVVYEKIVLVNDADTIRAWNILTGEPAWQSDRPDPAIIYPAVPDDPSPAPEKNCVGTPHFTMTIANNRLYARMGSPVTCSSTNELRPDLVSDLVCLDLTKEGKLIWKIAAHEMIRNDPTWRFEGSPTVLGGRTYIALCRRHPQLELMIACLDSSSGQLLWHRPIGAFRVSVDDALNRISHLLLTAGGGRIFLSTDVGVIVALDAVDGRLEWAVSYETRADETPTVPNDPGRKGLVPALFYDGRLFVAPSDANSAFCLEADSGRVQWKFGYVRPTPRAFPEPLRKDQERNRLRDKQWRHLLGVVPGGDSGRLIVSGSSLAAIDIDTKDIIWERSAGGATRSNRSDFGRGLITDGQILVPTREAIEVFDANSGEHLRQVLLKTPDTAESGGNLILAAGLLLIAEPSRLAAYGEYSRIKERLEQDLTERADDPQGQIHLADLERSEGHQGTAKRALQSVIDKLNPGDPTWIIARQRLSKLLSDAGKAELAKRNLRAAKTDWEQAIEITDDLTERVNLIFDIAKADEELNDAPAALVRLQQILNDPRLASVERNNQSVGPVAALAMSDVIAKSGRGTYDAIESVASVEIKAATQANDRRALRNLVERYPHSHSTPAARHQLVEMYRDANEVSEAYTILNQRERMSADARSSADAALATVQLLQNASYSRSADRLWQALAGSTTPMEVSFQGATQDLATLARNQLQHRDSGPTNAQWLKRTWSYPLPADCQVVFPNNEAPGSQFQSVLVCSKLDGPIPGWSWKCLDWRSGNVRWEETSSCPVKVAAWTAVHLLIGTANGWQARSAETGRQIWQQLSPSETDPMLIPQSGPRNRNLAWPASFHRERGLRFFDPDSGEPVCRLKPAGRLHSVVGREAGTSPFDSETEAANLAIMDAESKVTILLQTVKPTRTWMATAKSPRDRWQIEQVSESGEPWQTPPINIGTGFFNTTSDRQLVRLQLKEPPPSSHSEIDPPNPADIEEPAIFGNIEPPDETRSMLSTTRWTYKSFATAQAPPFAFAVHQNLLAVSDAMQINSFDPNTGARQWLTGLADYPLTDPQRQICAQGNLLFAASQGTLRCADLRNGTVCFEHYLGDTFPQWQTMVAWASSDRMAGESAVSKGQPNTSSKIPSGPTALIAAWPLTATKPGSVDIRLCDAKTGAVLQRLHVDALPRKLIIDADGNGVLWTDRRLSGVGFAEPQ